MNLYKVYNTYIESEIKLPSAMEFSAGEDIKADARIIYGDLTEKYEEVLAFKKTQNEVNNEGESTWMIYNQTATEGIFNIVEVGMFRVTNGNCIEYMKTVDVDVFMLEQWILNMCIPVMMIQRGRILLHGSGLVYGGNALIISGESGSGKSTLTNALLKEEFKFFSDDSVELSLEEEEGMKVLYGIGAYPLRRLCLDVLSGEVLEEERLHYMPDGGKEKYGYDMKPEFISEKVPLTALFIITAADTPEVSIREIMGGDKLRYFMDCLYKKGSYKRTGFSPKMLTDCLESAGKLHIYEIIRPKNAMTVEIQKKYLLNALKNL